MPYSVSQYAANRDKLLQHIIAVLSADERFVAAWLTGSFGRGEQDELSDLDLSVVVADSSTQSFCACSEEAITRITSDERLAFYQQFGRPLVLREQRSFEGSGCFNHVSYREIAAVVDWVFLPQAATRRPTECRLLFDRVGIPVAHPATIESVEERAARASSEVGFFWVMMTVALKYLSRRDTVAFYGFVSALYWAIQNVKRHVTGASWKYRRVDFALVCTQQEQAVMLRQLCEEMLALMPKVEALGGYVPDNPMQVIDRWLEMVD